MKAAVVVLVVGLGSAALPAHAAARFAYDLDRARLQLADARYAAAESLSRAMLGGIHGDNRRAGLDSAAALEVLVESLWKNDRERGSEPTALAERGVALRERWLGAQSPELAFSLCQLGAVLASNRRAKDAEAVARRALGVAEQARPPAPLATALAWHTLALTQYMQRNYNEARQGYRSGLEIRQSVLPPEHPLIGTSWRALASTSFQLEDVPASGAEWRRALEIADKSLRWDHPDRGRCLQGLSSVLYREQRYLESQRAAEQALQINERQLGPEHPQVAYSCLSLAWSLGASGDYGRARVLYERAHRILEAAYGPEDNRTLDALDRVAAVMIWNGECARALPLAEQVAATARRALGENHVQAITALTTVQQALECLGRVDSSLHVVVEESRLLAAAPKLDVMSMISALRREGRLRLRQGDSDSAIALIQRSLVIAPPRYGPTSPQVLLSEEWLGAALLAKGEPDSARRLLRRTAATVERLQGRSPSAAGVVLARLAAAEAACGDTLTAIATALRAESAGRDALRATARGFSEAEALAAAAVRVRGLDLALALLRRMTPPDSVTLAVWDAVVRSRVLVEDEIAARRQAAALADDSLRAELLKSRAELARLLARGPAGADSIWRSQVRDVQQRQDQAERTLAITSAASRSDRRRAATGIREVLAALREGTALVSYVRHQSGATFGSGSLWTALERGRDGRVAVRALGGEDTSDAVLAEWLAELSRLPTDDAEARAAEKRCRRAGEAVRKLFWDPVARGLGGATRVAIVPDGSLAFANLAALPAGANRWLIESGPTLALVGAERDLVSDPGESLGTGLVAFGGIDFDAHADLVASASGSEPESELRGPAPCRELRELRFEPLPESKLEADDVLAYWQAAGHKGELRVGSAASEAMLRKLAPGRRVLHLATHGFNVDPSCAAPSDTGARGVGGITKGPPGVPAPAQANPLQLSGLALAGANARASAPAGGEDGVLTAGELAAIDLSGSELVTLSACESGRGQVFAGEGVLGLRRAIRVAGARATVMSLWAVRDRPTRAWMNDFYRGLWADGLDLHAALRAASLAALARLRAQGRSTHPVEWAAMIAEGR